MVVESNNAPNVITINGAPHVVNVREFEGFLRQCEQFMTVNDSGFDTMVQIISDSILDGAPSGTTIEELRPQLKFIREVGFLIKHLATPIAVDIQDS